MKLYKVTCYKPIVEGLCEPIGLGLVTPAPSIVVALHIAALYTLVPFLQFQGLLDSLL